MSSEEPHSNDAAIGIQSGIFTPNDYTIENGLVVLNDRLWSTLISRIPPKVSCKVDVKVCKLHSFSTELGQEGGNTLVPLLHKVGGTPRRGPIQNVEASVALASANVAMTLPGTWLPGGLFPATANFPVDAVNGVGLNNEANNQFFITPFNMDLLKTPGGITFATHINPGSGTSEFAAMYFSIGQDTRTFANNAFSDNLQIYMGTSAGGQGRFTMRFHNSASSDIIQIPSNVISGRAYVLLMSIELTDSELNFKISMLYNAGTALTENFQEVSYDLSHPLVQYLNRTGSYSNTSRPQEFLRIGPSRNTRHHSYAVYPGMFLKNSAIAEDSNTPLAYFLNPAYGLLNIVSRLALPRYAYQAVIFDRVCRVFSDNITYLQDFSGLAPLPIDVKVSVHSRYTTASGSNFPYGNTSTTSVGAVGRTSVLIASLQCKKQINNGDHLVDNIYSTDNGSFVVDIGDLARQPLFFIGTETTASVAPQLTQNPYNQGGLQPYPSADFVFLIRVVPILSDVDILGKRIRSESKYFAELGVYKLGRQL